MPKFEARRHSSAMRIKTQFVSQVLTETAQTIRKNQQRMAEEWDLFEGGTGNLRNWLEGHFSVAAENDGGLLSMRYLNYVRFLDMPDPRRHIRQLKREGYHLYNRQVFGVLYNRTLPALRYGFTAEVQQQIGESLAEAAGGDRNKAILMAKSMRRGYGF